jgi:hypothetical protein
MLLHAYYDATLAGTPLAMLAYTSRPQNATGNLLVFMSNKPPS